LCSQKQQTAHKSTSLEKTQGWYLSQSTEVCYLYFIITTCNF